jgi:hypothetical protein
MTTSITRSTNLPVAASQTTLVSIRRKRRRSRSWNQSSTFVFVLKVLLAVRFMDMVPFIALLSMASTFVAALVPSSSILCNHQHLRASFLSLHLFHESDTTEPAVSLSTPSQKVETLLPPSLEDDDVSIKSRSLTKTNSPQSNLKKTGFDIDTAVFCAGLAFDSYVEPSSNSSRWERGVSRDQKDDDDWRLISSK